MWVYWRLARSVIVRANEAGQQTRRALAICSANMQRMAKERRVDGSSPEAFAELAFLLVYSSLLPQDGCRLDLFDERIFCRL